MIVVTRVLSADDTDVLASTDLANIPADGQLDVYAASTQSDTTCSITGPGNEPVIRLRPLQLRTNGQPSLETDVPFTLGAVQGGHYVINIDIVTAATVVVVAIFRDAGDA